jgi:hypothetical protein
MSKTARGVLVGAVVGAVVGLLVGVVVHAIFYEERSIAGYEIAGGLLGLIIGVILGAFYGGALNLPRGASRSGPR